MTIADTMDGTLKNKISIGSRVTVACGAAVINDVSDEDIVAGVPAQSMKNKVSSEQLLLMAGRHQ
jgi:UDP-3-O-[3-hydroxymyristoyl] glucosamine N-acyltransferase